MIDSDELALIRSSVAHVLETVAAPAVPETLLELGWAELLDSEPADVVTLTAEAQGRLGAATPVLDLVALASAGLVPRPSVAVVLPPPARDTTHSATADRGVLEIDGVALAGYERADEYLLLTSDGLWQVPAAALKAVAMTRGDVDLGLARISGEVPTDAATMVGEADDVQSVLAAGRRFLASELVGLADELLIGARDYVLARHQFGHPIGVFQTVKHRLADVRVAVTAARAGATTAWSDRTRASATAAKCLAGQAQTLAATHCHQVQGGIAFTAEHGFHRAIQRGHLLDALLGTTRELTRTLGHQILADGAVPRTPQLSA